MGIQQYNVHCGPDSPQAVNGPRFTNGLLWTERHHGAYMGQKLQWDGIILDGPDDATGLNFGRP